MIVEYLIALIGQYFTFDLAFYWFYPLLCIYLIGCVPAIFRFLTSWR